MPPGVTGEGGTLSLPGIDQSRMQIVQEMHGIGKEDLFGRGSDLLGRFIGL